MRVAIITTYAHKLFSARKELLNGIQELDCQVVVMGPEKEELCSNPLKRLGIDYVQLNIKRVNINPVKEILALNDIKKKLTENNIDCVLIYGIRMIPSVVLAAKLAKIKHIVCIVNGAGNLLMASGVKGKAIQLISFPMLSLGLRNANKVIFQNRDDYNELKQKHLINNDNICFTNGSGVNIDFYKELPLPHDLEFLLVTRITGSKGINEFVNAAKLVRSKYPAARFGLVGPKDDKDGSVDWELIEVAEKEGTLQYYGESNDVKGFLEKCRIYVFPSYYREGVPRSVLEAMAVGRPIITTNSPGCRETVIDGKNGFLIPPKDIESLAERMIWMIENPKRVEKMAKESRELALTKFDVNKVNGIILKELKLNLKKIIH